ncbi:hypothetical protein [Thermogemmata fonticola]|jgi:uncharacterized membrane protein YheB (UPF0754 family)|uniref:Uncharacterized protein n=1 Tax=Thermogemmata fonticola TaxID=2755323 RepID=A0A7V8VCP6_9BACT|nr:hypothetical protein [Thermogemmata fonticola]MBA2225658.1 hypothetical protein [Thermogemmata fonticola]
MASMEEVKRRFVNEIKLRAYDDKYIDRNEEKEILQTAIQMGVNIDSARAALAQVCDENDYILESRLIQQIKDQLQAAMGDDGRIDRKEFDMIVNTAKNAVKGRKNERELQRMVITVMEDTGQTQVKRGWFSDWYSSLKRELGMA